MSPKLLSSSSPSQVYCGEIYKVDYYHRRLCYLKWSSQHESLQHLERGRGHIHGYQMPSAEQLHEREPLVALETARHGSVDDKGFVRSQQEAELPRPGQRVCPGAAAHPVDNGVVLAVVDQHGHARLEEAAHRLLVRTHPVARKHKLDLNKSVARLPFLFLGSQRGQVSGRVEPVGDGAKVVAERRLVALGGDVVQVDARHLDGEELARVAHRVRIGAREPGERLCGARHVLAVEAAGHASRVRRRRRA
mmetsp:Transcript_52907/g.115446  ORF Transcript_52907/g.115446 Transcript_52907/m.115446 type:complete len:249 (-) Transcript_52907:401-1147(-)